VFLLPTLAQADDAGFTCEGKQSEVKACVEPPCEGGNCRDCSWSEWSEWAPPTCLGLCERHREIAEPNNFCGQPCHGPLTETKFCEPDCEKPPQNCETSEWSDWTKCTELCGGGQTFRERKVTQFPKHGGLVCSTELTQTKPCNTHVCNEPQNCVLSDWEPWTECTRTCEGGVQKRVRRIEAVAMYGGVPCQGDLKEVRACHEEACDMAVDCAWGEWGYWSDCSASCDGGEQTRMRLIETTPKNGGKVCKPGDMVEVQACNKVPCGTVVDCGFSSWSYWSDCSQSCNGVKTRTREVSAYPEFGGRACDGGLKEIQGCNTTPDLCIEETPDPVDCVFDDWSYWGKCSKTCGGGMQKQTREVYTPAKNQGLPCQGETERVRPCAEEHCVEPPHEVVNCKFGEWGYWNECSQTCGGGQMQRSRKIEVYPNKYGAPCARESTLEVTECGSAPCECKDCVWGEWSYWGACTCEGLQERHRSVASHRDSCGMPCIGAKVETQMCDPDCRHHPVDCKMAEWTAWSDCSAECGGGQKIRTRAIKTPEKNEGKPCDNEEMKQTAACNTQQCEMKQDCALSYWSSWTACSVTCGGGQKYRTREVESSASGGGEGCKANLKEVESCNVDPCVEPIDCVWGEWTEYGACSASCGGGQKVRDREIVQAPRYGGKLCDPHTKEEVAPCNRQSCDTHCIDGAWDQWAEWSTCTATCGTGFQIRNREILQRPNGCGKPLEGKREEVKKCDDLYECEVDTVDCAFSEWSWWGDCSCECNGIMDRSRRIETRSKNGGKPCAGPVKEIKPCNVESCHDFDPVDCVLSEWSYWSDCTATCAGGAQERTREIEQSPKNNGKPCRGSLHEVQACNLNRCDSAVDCKWSSWSEWGECTADCNGGQKTRFRRVEKLPKDGGNACRLADAQEEVPCNTHMCGEVNYCAWEEWTAFSACSATCGLGTQKRDRRLFHTSKKPAEGVSLLATGILDAVWSSRMFPSGGGRSSRATTSPGDTRKYTAENMFVTFCCGLLTTFVALAVVSRGAWRRRDGSSFAAIGGGDGGEVGGTSSTMELELQERNNMYVE